VLKANDAEIICSLLANVIKTPEEVSADPGFMVRAEVKELEKLKELTK